MQEMRQKRTETKGNPSKCNKNDEKTVIALFNLADKTNKVSIGLNEAGVTEKVTEGIELWTNETVKIARMTLSAEIEPHGVAVVELYLPVKLNLKELKMRFFLILILF